MFESTHALRSQLRSLTDELCAAYCVRLVHSCRIRDQKSLTLERMMIDEAKNKQTITSLNAKVCLLTARAL